MFLYRITCKINEKQYIGITSMPKIRFSDHARTKSLIGSAMRKYGKDNFEMQILVEGEDSFITDLEPRAILAFQTLYPGGYNLSLQTQTSFKHHELTKEKMRKPKSIEARKNMSLAKKNKPNGRKGKPNPMKKHGPHGNTGKIRSQDFKDNLTGKIQSDETKNKRKKTKEGMDLTQPIVTCPHCYKQGGAYTMPRWHFDRCTLKGKEND
jgi:group I intron endonuclease